MKTKIVKVVAGLTLVAVVGISAFSCANKNPESYIDVAPKDEEFVLNTDADSILAGGSSVNLEDANSDTETQAETTAKVEKYQALDFQKVSDYDAEYETLIVKREEYYKTMKLVVDFSALHSTEDIAYAIYNVVKVDNDLSCLLLKIYEQRLAAAENQVYLADQIESLEDVLNKMRDLKAQINEASVDFEKALDRLSEADVEQIERVQKYSVTPLNRPINQLEKKVEQLKEDLEAALNAQS